MKIIAGKHKGKYIAAPKNLPVRPTTGMAKEALFNILGNYFYFDEVTVLDLFAGTGNICFEFVSRGTQQVTAVDQYFGCTKFIAKIAKELKAPINVIKSDVFKYLEKSTSTFDIIFADPPYNFTTNQFSTIEELVFKRNLLSKEGVLIIEHSKHTSLNDLPYFSYFKKYGGTVFSFFEWNLK
ncbi:MAG: RsmD family RNA methyltransferase [Lutibacter sp.]